MKTKTNILDILAIAVLAALLSGLGGMAWAEEVIFGKVISVNTEQKALRLERTRYPTGRVQELTVSVPASARFKGVESLQDIKPGDEVKLEISKALLSDTITAKAVESAKEPQRAEIMYGKIAFIDREKKSLRIRFMDRESNAMEERTVLVPENAKFRGFKTLSDLNVGQSVRLEAHRGMPGSWTAEVVRLAEEPERGEMIYGKITAVDTEASAIRLERKNPDSGKAEELLMLIPDSVQLHGIKHLRELKIGDNVIAEARRNLLLGSWTAAYLEPGSEPSGGEPIVGTIQSVEIDRMVLVLQRRHPKTGNPEEIIVMVPRSARLMGADSLSDLRAGDAIRLDASKEMFGPRWTAYRAETGETAEKGVDAQAK